MTPDQFLGSIARQAPAPAYLFIGPEAYRRGMCRKALIARVLEPEEIEAGFTRHDLDEMTLAGVVDDARAISLFAPKRVIWVSSAESALPKGRAVSDDEEAPKDAAALLTAYLKDPTPGVVLVFDAARFDFEGEDKTKIERVRKFYSAVPAVVEFARLEPLEARRLAADLARSAGLKIGQQELELLVLALGGDASRIAIEIEKLALYVKEGRAVTEADLAALVPDARDTTIFALVNALGRADRTRSLEILDTLVREGEYLPLMLTFIGTQFRFALAAKEANLKSVQQVQSFFQGRGTPMWRSRAEQVYQTATAFSTEKLQKAVRRIYCADRDLRDTRPDDRIVMEEFILALTA